MNYNLYLAEDFATDESFIAYYLKTDVNAIKFWEDWISHHPEKIDEIFNAEQILALMYLRLPDEEFQSESSRFDDFLNVVAAEQISTKRKFTFRHSTILTAIAASVIVVIFAIFYFSPANQSLTYITKHNGNGKISSFYLSDGTKVILNANSSIKLPEVFGTDKRDVSLTGEAFFEVAKDPSRPFTVEANGTKTTVLGTKFNVSAYGNSSHIQVALQEGSVEFSANADRDKMRLRPMEMATFSKNSKTLVRTAFNLDAVSSWKTGQITFHHATFQDISERFKNSYGIVLIDQSGKKDWNYSGHFVKTDYLSIIKSICFAENLNFKQTNQTIELKLKK
ncbi:hypothetical protein DHW03_16185 [Pedobacter yonginense]|uniref:Uncharacterized protein n=1 Tax=Pedobacter yonginense TaxID=651869 RepID=A0A317EI57_9SPHI|nr:FecR family protein [Pedobacter yonginense]PWS26322.1 hypothetical protein DHW03_16185 [Pedobacter yonginense]